MMRRDTTLSGRRLARVSAAVVSLAALVATGLTWTTPALASEGVVDPTTTVVEAPTNLELQPGDRMLTVTFVPPAVGEGTSIDGYDYSLDGGTTWEQLSLLEILGISKMAIKVGEIHGVLNGQGYAVQVRAVTSAGAGEASAAVVTETTAWFHDPLSKAQRRALVKVPARPRDYAGKPARTVAYAASRNGTPAVPVSALQWRQLQAGQAVTYPASLFKPGSATLTATGRQAVIDTVASLSYVGSVQCEGYADYAGRLTAQQRLAQGRAATVCRVLVAEGAAVKAWVQGFGPTRPMLIGGTNASRTGNGRVVVLVLT